MANEVCFKEFFIKLISEGLIRKRGADARHKERLTLMAVGSAILKYKNKDALDFYVNFLKESAVDESRYLAELEKVEFVKLPFGETIKEIPVFQHVWRPAYNSSPWRKFASIGLVQALHGAKGEYGYVNNKTVKFENLNFGEPEVKKGDSVLVLGGGCGYDTIASKELAGENGVVDTTDIRLREIINTRVATRLVSGKQANTYKQISLKGLGKYDKIVFNAPEPYNDWQLDLFDIQKGSLGQKC
jgi:hypothetical protein